MKKILLVLFILFCPLICFSQHYGTVTVDSDSSTYFGAGATNCEGQNSWVFYQTNDAPEGAWNNYGHDPLVCNITLSQQITGGTTYYIFTYFGDYDVHRTINYTACGSTSSSVATDDRDYNRYWSERVTLVQGSSCGTLTIHVEGNTGTESSRLFRAFYITTNSAVTMTSNGTVINLTVPTIMDDSVAVPGNLIANSGFKTGITPDWSIYENKTYSLDSIWDADNSQLKLPLDASFTLNGAGPNTDIYTRVYHLKPNKKYAFSAYVKVDSGTQTIGLNLFNTYDPPSGFTAQPVYAAAIVATTSYQRVCLSGNYLISYPSPDFYGNIHLSVNSTDNYLYVKDVQLEEGASCTTYGAAHSLETQLTITNPGHIYFSNGTLTASLKAYNTTGSPVSKTVKYEIYDSENKLISSGSTDLTVAATTLDVSSFSLAVGGKLGLFRVRYWILGENGTDKEISYSIIPPTTTSVDATSQMGISSNYTAFQLAAYQRLGVKWLRDMSPAECCRWGLVEATEGTFTYRNSTVMNLPGTYNFKMMANLDASTQPPSYAGTPPDPTKYATYSTNVVNHYKSIITDWEIDNEPLSASGRTASAYAQMLKSSIEAIEAEDPTAKIHCMGGLSGTNISAVIAASLVLYPSFNLATHCDSYVTHDYPGGVDPASLTTFVNAGVPVINSETGLSSHGPFVGPYSNWVNWGKQILGFNDATWFYREFIDVPNLIVTNYGATIASKQSRYFYYDGRIAAETNNLNQHVTLLEYDGSIRTKGVAYAIENYFIDHSTGQGNISTDSNSLFYLFDRGMSDPIALVSSSDHKPRQIILSGVSHGDIAVYDRMGNAITFTGVTIEYGRIPIYVVGVGLSLNDFNSSFVTGVASLRSDTVAPNLIVTRGPIDASTLTDRTVTVRFQWIALDETSVPNAGEIEQEALGSFDIPNPEAIMYMYRLVGYSGWSDWTQNTFIDYSGLTDGIYTFEVKSKDAAGNISSTASRDFTFGAGSNGSNVSNAGFKFRRR